MSIVAPVTNGRADAIVHGSSEELPEPVGGVEIEGRLLGVTNQQALLLERASNGGWRERAATSGRSVQRRGAPLVARQASNMTKQPNRVRRGSLVRWRRHA